MATSEDSFPTLSSSVWWRLRRKFNSNFPKSAISDEYLASVLEMKKVSVRNNGILANLKLMKLLDEESKCTERANIWRIDEKYTQVCQDILKDVYPQELLDIGTSPENRNSIFNWFKSKKGAGDSQASKLTQMYLLLANPDLSQQDKDAAKSSTKNSNNKKGNDKKQDVTSEKEQSSQIYRETAADNRVGEGTATTSFAPALNINIQIHISADSTAEQIDQIFASMAKHLNLKK